MVNPPKDETVRIRKLLEKFGSVGDANVFYWFQNRRSRSRRRQRQIQAAIAAASSDSGTHPGGGGGCASATPSLVITSPSSSASTSSPVTVLINGVPLEVPRGPFDMRAMFGCDSVLFHSSGGALPVDEHGVLSQSLQMGESYYLVRFN
ncbi:WUSCHEL-related homeobox 6 [Apostasia shenzhenica]|uniref:WUSCHEL-related homeobox 6 n=1 Tax=Apostasia shenzhenica TaxID=1088818 RepID=A0A2I0ASR3_9ASPA|nr:WUSCHEL-related homeobox 6 [Apostasia shenzhenica]